MFKYRDFYIGFISLIFMVAGFYILLNYNLQGFKLYKDIDEQSGVILSIVLGFSMVLYLLNRLKKALPQNQNIKKITSLVWKYHISAAILSIGLLVLHAGVSIDVRHLFDEEHISGYVLGLFYVLILYYGFVFALKKEKQAKKYHIYISLIGVIPFVVHIFG